MIVAVASGKGGTGKTTIAANLAWTVSRLGQRVRYVDCDVEEPNGHLFLKPRIDQTERATVAVPEVDQSRCDACGDCVAFCEYKALVRLGKTVMLFPELCHGCGGCTLVCTRDAISETQRPIGAVETGRAGTLEFRHGRLSVGEAMSPPLIRRVLDGTADSVLSILDAPPGTSCPVVAAVRRADYVLLVTEPTPFGLNDLSLALDMVRDLGIRHGVVINRWLPGNSSAEEFCAKRGVTVVGCLEDQRGIAEAYSRGEMICESVPAAREWFVQLWAAVRKQAGV